MSGDWLPATRVAGERSVGDNPCEYCGDRLVDHSPNELKSCADDLSARADYLYLDLKGALERLCRAQTNMPAWWRADAQQAINIVQEIGSAVCPDAWSKHDQPEYPEATS